MRKLRNYYYYNLNLNCVQGQTVGKKKKKKKKWKLIKCCNQIFSPGKKQIKKAKRQKEGNSFYAMLKCCSFVMITKVINTNFLCGISVLYFCKIFNEYIRIVLTEVYREK